MYRSIVARRVRRTWERLGRRDYAAVLDQLSPSFEHRFAGRHALAGARSTEASQFAWFERLFRILPDIQFTPRDVIVTGWPWRTRVIAIVGVHVSSEPAYANELIQVIDLRWGRINAISNHEDSQLLAELLERRAAAGVDEAIAPPISDTDRDRVVAEWVGTNIAGPGRR